MDGGGGGAEIHTNQPLFKPCAASVYRHHNQNVGPRLDAADAYVMVQYIVGVSLKPVTGDSGSEKIVTII